MNTRDSFGDFMISQAVKQAVKKDNEVAQLQERIRTLESACEAALETFQSVQWINRGDHSSCGGCGNWSESGHHPECPIRTTVEQLEGAIRHG